MSAVMEIGVNDVIIHVVEVAVNNKSSNNKIMRYPHKP